MYKFISTNAFGHLFRIRVTDEMESEINKVQTALKRSMKDLPEDYEQEVEKEFPRKDFDTESSRDHLTLKITPTNYQIGQYWEEGFEEMDNEINYIGYLLAEPGEKVDRSFLTDDEIKLIKHEYWRRIEKESLQIAKFKLLQDKGIPHKEIMKIIDDTHFNRDKLDMRYALESVEHHSHLLKIKNIWKPKHVIKT